MKEVLRLRWGVALVLTVALQIFGAAQTQPRDLTEVSLEDLMNIRVTSVSKREQKISKAGAAIYVINQEDIRQSGATNIPDLLRMVPGIHVAQINAHTWAISIRGFTDKYGDKVLVMIDGRSVYSPLSSGVDWDQQDVPLENIDRIEVIRGPGGTVWGANAVNGVINIITKKAKDTQGGLVVARTGSEENARGLVQYGGKAGADGFYRVYGNYFNIASGALANGGEGVDGWHGIQGGFRSDWSLSPQDTLTVQGDYNGSSEGQALSVLFSDRLPGLNTFADTVRVGSENLLARWTHHFSNNSEADIRVYYDRYRRFDMGLNTVNTGDVDAQYRFHFGDRHDIVAG